MNVDVIIIIIIVTMCDHSHNMFKNNYKWWNVCVAGFNADLIKQGIFFFTGSVAVVGPCVCCVLPTVCFGTRSWLVCLSGWEPRPGPCGPARWGIFVAQSSSPAGWAGGR